MLDSAIIRYLREIETVQEALVGSNVELTFSYPFWSPFTSQPKILRNDCTGSLVT